MIPNISALESAASGVLKSVPEGLTQGRIPAGLYGLGFLGRWALPRLKERGVRLVSCHDANSSLEGTFADGVPIRAPGELGSSRPEFVIVTARHAVRPVSKMLSDLSIRHVSYDAWHVASDFAAFRDIHDRILSDERSRAVLRAILMAMLTGESRYCAAVSEADQYFCLEHFRERQDDIYVDAGAYDGDSTEQFIARHDGAFDKIFAFEPGPYQFAALKARAERLKAQWSLKPDSIALINAGLGDARYATRATSANGELTSLAAGAYGVNGTAVDIVALDGFCQGAPITFLKADVEGMEMALLAGARTTIRRHKPKLAVCVYHYPTDIPEIANFLHGLVPEYRFALRHHSPQLMETVLYCWAD